MDQTRGSSILSPIWGSNTYLESDVFLGGVWWLAMSEVKKISKLINELDMDECREINKALRSRIECLQKEAEEGLKNNVSEGDYVMVSCGKNMVNVLCKMEEMRRTKCTVKVATDMCEKYPRGSRVGLPMSCCRKASESDKKKDRKEQLKYGVAGNKVAINHDLLGKKSRKDESSSESESDSDEEGKVVIEGKGDKRKVVVKCRKAKKDEYKVRYPLTTHGEIVVEGVVNMNTMVKVGKSVSKQTGLFLPFYDKRMSDAEAKAYKLAYKEGLLGTNDKNQYKEYVRPFVRKDEDGVLAKRKLVFIRHPRNGGTFEGVSLRNDVFELNFVS